MKRLLLALIDFYRREISPRVPPTCRFTPTCSAYAREAIERHGALRGCLLGIWRVLRCNPFTKGGYDPVPPVRKRGDGQEVEHHADSGEDAGKDGSPNNDSANLFVEG